MNSGNTSKICIPDLSCNAATTTLLSYVLGLGQVLKLVQAATQGKRDLLQGLLRLRVSDLSAQLSAPDWLSGEGAREATQSCAKVGVLVGSGLFGDMET